MSDGSPTMTVPELAERMGIDPSTAWRYLRSGKLPGVQVSSRWLIDRQRVERFLAGKEDAAGNPLVATEATARNSLVAAGDAARGPVLELLPRVTPATTPEMSQALAWLHGLMAALELLAAEIETTAEREASQRVEA